ncbi:MULTISPECIES: hypothetical protein [unclassified Leptolyngbya]|uniref:hypothetical protein n=1 Tax=unclassified Leptolyngbya TaxID=2650499 RepID=UPI001689FB37|nr:MULTISPECIES: hypothetical protein [unclassified Leptolyngbya]MBD1913716.1 hypothetical protein [Leptolyngbya sp. FACHB-8]MBD2155320.1 hypothetical protein [Leptolyngbya sp. FACHB-16]
MDAREHLTAKLEHLDTLADTFEASKEPEDVARLARVLIDSAEYNTPESDLYKAAGAEYVEALKDWWQDHKGTLDKARGLINS